MLGFAAPAAAQDIHGIVTDADNQPLVGASVYWAGTTIGASTSATGEDSVHRVKNYDLLVASYLGYVNDTIRIEAGVAEQSFQLKSEGVDIESVVVESTLGGNYIKSAAMRCRCVPLRGSYSKTRRTVSVNRLEGLCH